MTDEQKKALDEEEKAVEEREKINKEGEKETEDSVKVVDDQLKEVEIEKRQAEDLDSSEHAETTVLSTTLQNFVNSSAPATTSATGPSTSLALTPPAPPESSLPASRPQTVASSFSPLRPPQQTSGIVLTSPATTGPSTSLTLSPPAPPESSLPAATFSRSQTVASSSFSPLRPPSGIVPTPPESSLPAATFPRPPTGASSFSPLRPASGNLLTAPTFATLPFFPSRNISTQPVFVGPPDVTLGPRNAARFTWTPQQKQSFDEAIQRLGGLYGKSVTATAKDVKELMEDDDVTESQIANRIQNMRRKHPRDDGGESSSGKKQC
ncbi:hypothetical protein Bca52824_025958 [Brassica carinata]|uniref:Myb-like domain-containing protein n=1 Tax=Brassica carinata TaxID=52824 RepID=A0A8X7V7F9_BRACI|nr:hypothetical protein Bca52824_025958 [Brassica carinata]